MFTARERFVCRLQVSEQCFSRKNFHFSYYKKTKAYLIEKLVKTKSMSIYDPVHKHRRLWNDPESIIKDSLAGTLMIHKNLTYLEKYNVILRQDHSKLVKKVRVIGGGSVIDGPTYAGFVGPGMLTAAVLGLQGGTSSMPDPDTICEAIVHVAKDEQQTTNGILILVHDCIEYFITFMNAKNKIESKGVPVKIILVRDERNEKLKQKPQSPRSPSGLLLFYKIAGAMAEEGRSLNEIYDVCDKIVKNKLVYSIGIYIEENPSYCNNVHEVHISRGDRLSDSERQHLPIKDLSTKDLVKKLIHDLINNCQTFTQGSKIILLLDYFGGFTEMESSVVIVELIDQLNQCKIETELIFMGSFRTSLESIGFHLSVLNQTNQSELLYYLNAPTLAFSWPKFTNPRISKHVNGKTKNCTKEISQDSANKNKDNENTVASNVSAFEIDILLTAIEFACEALIACGSKIDMLDHSSSLKSLPKCGTRLANIAKTVKISIFKKQFVDLNLSDIIFKVALIFKQKKQDPQAELYAIFLDTIGKTIEDQEYLEAGDWLDAFVQAIHLVDSITKGTKFSDTLYAAKAAFCDAYAEDENVNVLQALGQAVTAAQKQTSHVLLDSGKISESLLKNLNEKDCGFCGLAGAHAIGVWMRGAYEGIKLKYSRSKPLEKRARLSTDDSEHTGKKPRVSDDASFL